MRDQNGAEDVFPVSNCLCWSEFLRACRDLQVEVAKDCFQGGTGEQIDFCLRRAPAGDGPLLGGEGKKRERDSCQENHDGQHEHQGKTLLPLLPPPKLEPGKIHE